MTISEVARQRRLVPGVRRQDVPGSQWGHGNSDDVKRFAHTDAAIWLVGDGMLGVMIDVGDQQRFSHPVGSGIRHAVPAVIHRPSTGREPVLRRRAAWKFF